MGANMGRMRGAVRRLPPIEFGGETVLYDYRYALYTGDKAIERAIEVARAGDRAERASRKAQRAVDRAQQALDRAFEDHVSEEVVAELEAALEAAQDAAFQVEADGLRQRTLSSARQVAELGAWWDGEDEGGNPIPLETEALAREVPLPLLIAILEACDKANTVDPLKAPR